MSWYWYCYWYSKAQAIHNVYSKTFTNTVSITYSKIHIQTIPLTYFHAVMFNLSTTPELYSSPYKFPRYSSLIYLRTILTRVIFKQSCLAIFIASFLKICIVALSKSISILV